MGGLAGVSMAECKKQIDFYLEKTSLIEHQKKKNRQLSGGMKRRVGLVQAMLNNSEILIVDEPTTGLDPEERIRIRNLLVDFSKDRIILFSTHVTEDLAATCNTLGILKKGNLIYNGKKDTLLNLAKDGVWVCKLKNEEEYNLLQNKYIVSTKNYKEDGIEARIFTDKKPDVPGVNADVTLEDAYIYIIIRDTNTARSVTKIFDQLYEILGHDKFIRLFQVILTDRGSEFTNPLAIEFNENNERRTHIFY